MIHERMLEERLWDHQSRAIELVRDYMSAFRKSSTTGSALVHMPTGTGKTGVIAFLSQFEPGVGCTLILTPRVALRDQLAREVDGRFFSRLSLRTGPLPKAVRNVVRALPELSENECASTILVMTIQMLYSIFNRRPDTYRILADHVDLVIVDEGHYEPAMSWRDAIRGLQKPKVIFTATPFRNDLKLFDINYDHAFSYTLDEAVDDGIVRRISILTRPHPGNPRDFVKDVVEFYDQYLAAGVAEGEDPPRVIIRCDSQASIRQIGAALDAAGRSYVLIHENFSDDDKTRPRERRRVPDPDDEDATFWVHQFKLLEGIDDHRFRLLALYKELRTTREFVQQVGRVLRNPRREHDAVAYVLDHSNGRQKELWDGFIAFDAMLRRKGVSVLDFGKNILEALMRAQPDVTYIDGKFRTKFTLDSIDAASELMLPFAVNVFRKSPNFDFDDLCIKIASEYEQQDRLLRKVAIDPNTQVILYLTFRNSPLLKTQCFIESRFGVTILREVGSYICLFDSEGGLPSALERHAEKIRVDELRRIFGKQRGAYLTEVGLRNTVLGPRVIRSRTITGARIEDIAPSFDDHAFVCRAARGYVLGMGNKLTRHYIGFQRGRIAEQSPRRVKLTEYLDWLDIIADILAEGKKAAPVFARYASPANAPSDPEPMNVLLDLQDVLDKFLTTGAHGVRANEPMSLQDACAEVQNGTFSIVGNGYECRCAIRFDPPSSRYIITSPELDELYFSKEKELESGIVKYLNRTQSFRVIPKTVGSFYTLGEFYSPILRFGAQYDDDQFGLLKILMPADRLREIGSEKGRNCLPDGKGWDRDSLFAIIDNLGRGYGLNKIFGDPDILVCDDLGTEAADFILADTSNRRVVFIHVKGNSGAERKYAASPLQEVCGQATKNLKFFARYGSEVPPKAPHWHRAKWAEGRRISGYVARRIRRPKEWDSTGRQLWERIRSIIRDPLSDLEVWLFLGKLISKAGFEAQLRSTKPAPEAVQAAYLLFSTMNDAATVGAGLRVICSP